LDRKYVRHDRHTSSISNDDDDDDGLSSEAGRDRGEPTTAAASTTSSALDVRSSDIENNNPHQLHGLYDDANHSNQSIAANINIDGRDRWRTSSPDVERRADRNIVSRRAIQSTYRTDGGEAYDDDDIDDGLQSMIVSSVRDRGRQRWNDARCSRSRSTSFGCSLAVAHIEICPRPTQPARVARSSSRSTPSLRSSVEESLNR